MTTRRAAGRLRLRAVLLLLSAAVPAVLSMAAADPAAADLAGSGTAPATPAVPSPSDPSLDVSAVRTTPGIVQFYLTADGLPSGTALDPGRVVASAGGRILQVSATGMDSGPATALVRSVVMVLDTSGSMAGRPLADAEDAAVRYAAAVPADVRLGLVAVGDRPETLLRPTTDRPAFTAAVRRLRARGETALYDGIAQGSALLAQQHADEKRLLILSDGADTKSRTTLERLTLLLRRDGSTVDLVAFGTKTDGAALERIAAASDGGSLQRAGESGSLTGAFLSAATTFTARLHVTVRIPGALAGHKGSMTIQAQAAGKTLIRTTPITFAAGPGAGAPPKAVSVAGPPGWLYPAGAGAVALGVLLAIVAFSGPRSGLGARRLAELDGFSGARRGDAPQRAKSALPVPVPDAALQFTDRMVRARGRHEQIATQLEQAGMRLLPREWTIMRFGAAFTGMIVVGVVLSPVLGVLLGPPLGWGACGLYRRHRASRRTKRFADQLPDALTLVVGSLRSGFSLGQSLGALVRESAEPVAGEFGRALAETRLGVDLEDALERTAERTGSRDLSWLVMAIRIQREVGGNLAEIMETAVETMRERARLRRHVRSLTAEGRLSAYVLLALPICLAAWMFLMRGEYVRPLYTEPLGIAMLVVAVIMVAIGAFWMSRLIKVEV